MKASSGGNLAMKKARRPENPGRRALFVRVVALATLEHPKHDGADKGDCDIRGNNVHFADQRTQQSHRNISVVHVTARLTPEASKPFRAQKVSPADLLPLVHRVEAPATWLKNCKINALKSL